MNRAAGAAPPPRAGSPRPAKCRAPCGSRTTLVRPLSVTVGLSDGSMTEVQSDNLSEGTEIVVGEAIRGASSSTETTNPFTPQVFRARRPQQSQ